MNAHTALPAFRSNDMDRTAAAARRRQQRHGRFEALLLRSYAIMRARKRSA